MTLGALVEAAVRALVLGMLTGALLWLLRVRNVSAQRIAWIIVLLAAIAMPILMRFSFTPALLVRGPVPSDSRSHILGEPSPFSRTAEIRYPSTGQTEELSRARSAKSDVFHLNGFASGRFSALSLSIYLAVATALIVRLFLGLIFALRLWNRATPIADLNEQGLRVRTSREVSSPVTIGSGVVLPIKYQNWSQQELRAVLAHERTHVHNFDFYVQLLAALYAAVVWFSPLGWWLLRRLAVLSESICDQAGILELGRRAEYAQVVLQFATLARRPFVGVAMACTGNVSRRIEQLLNENLYHAAFSKRPKRTATAFLLIACAISSTALLIQVPKADAAQTAPSAAPAVLQDPVMSPPSPLSASPEKATRKVVNVRASAVAEVRSGDVQSYSFGSSEAGSYALVDGASTSFTLSGNSGKNDMQRDIDKARHMTNNGKFLWFRRDGKSYVITDPTIVAQLQALYQPMEELGRQQEELGKQQEELGRQQEELGKKQEAASVPTPDMSREIADLRAAVAKLEAMKGKDSTQDQLADIQEKLGSLQGRIGELQGEIGEKQGSFGSAQGHLGAEQGRLGAQQGRLGEQQAKIAEQADKKVRAVIEESLKNGSAKPVE